MSKWQVIQKTAVIGLFITAFFVGRIGGQITERKNTAEVFAEGSWGLSFQEEGEQPVGNATEEELKEYDAWFVGDAKDKKIYLTFDCGYENGNTPKILEALKKHQAPAAFFVVGNYLDDNPELVRQMVEEGHIVGNHTVHHPDMTKYSDIDSFQKELAGVEERYQEITGKKMDPFFRPPQGKYSRSSLQMAKKLGYHTIFWSLAYVDWDTNAQPSREEAMRKLTKRIHPGAIVLLHNTSATNGEIMDELLTRLEEQGYQFGRLSDLIETTSKSQ